MKRVKNEDLQVGDRYWFKMHNSWFGPQVIIETNSHYFIVESGTQRGIRDSVIRYIPEFEEEMPCQDTTND